MQKSGRRTVGYRAGCRAGARRKRLARMALQVAIGPHLADGGRRRVRVRMLLAEYRISTQPQLFSSRRMSGAIQLVAPLSDFIFLSSVECVPGAVIFGRCLFGLSPPFGLDFGAVVEQGIGDIELPRQVGDF